MNNYSHFGFENLAYEDGQRLKEKQKIRSGANIIGVAYIILWLLPSVISRIISDAARIFGIQNAVAQLYADPAFIMVFQTVLSVAVFTLPFLIVPVSTGKRTGELMSFSKPEKGLLLPMVLMGVGASAFANLSTNSIAAFFSGFGIEFLSPDIQYPTGILGFVLSFLSVAVTPALTEEFAMRGIVMGSLRKHGDGFAILMSAVIFALIHGNLVQIPFAFIMGIMIGYAVVKTGSFWTGVIIHFINNGISVVISYLTQGISSVILQNAVSVTYFALCFLCFFIGIFVMGKKDNWRLNPSETLLTLGDKIKYFLSSPCIIISAGLTVIDCIGYIYIR